MRRMRLGFHFASLVSTAALLGCALPTTTPSSPPEPGPLTGNWQVQTLTSISAGAVVLTGALQADTSQITGIFSSHSLPCSPAIDNFTGSIDSTGTLSLTAPFVVLQLQVPTTSATVLNGTLTAGGDLCQTIMSGSVVATQIASLTGTYTGTLTDSSAPGLSGTAILALTQTAAPNSSGQFPLSGSITFPSSSGFGTAPLGGTVAGEGIALSDSSTAPNSPTVNLTAAATADGSKITVSNLLYSNFGPGAVFNFTGTLTRQ
jgi:hypothetical protein